MATSADSRTVLVAMAAVTVVSLGVALWLAVTRGPGPGDPRPEATRGPFGEGRQRVTEGDFAGAIPLLEQYVSEHPEGRNAGRALLFLGKANVGLGRLEEARGWFHRCTATFPKSLEGHKCRYKLALVDLWQGRADAAIAGFAETARRPDGPLAPEAAAMHLWLTKRSAIPPEAPR